MAVHTCLVQNNLTFVARFVIGSAFGMVQLILLPSQTISVPMSDGQKSFAVFNVETNTVVSQFYIDINGPTLINVPIGPLAVANADPVTQDFPDTPDVTTLI